ncbi:hypothetical protein SS50377_28039 [Spironucleus salmonicida]|uniref:Uncharacterized protein n=1 Tax=Spironucleus salmonicida TaxID=348837 RepID=V6LE88_9EUKA|nr:hypothetical protein SS50377_28039 [Spironucleus salmonicida]|eukprot:EST42593.1 Hypothetical protein SS50377_17912 [Spironucleus salmonicida]
MENPLVPSNPTPSIPTLSKSQKRSFKLQKRQNKITFDPKDMHNFANQAQARHKERQLKYNTKKLVLKQEEEKQIRNEKNSLSGVKIQSGIAILKKVKKVNSMTIEDIKKRLLELQNEGESEVDAE